MKIGIIFAMEEEINEMKKISEITNEFEMFGIKFYETFIDGKTCILALCGVGKVNSARCTQIIIDIMKVDFIINVGVAGGLSDNLNVHTGTIASGDIFCTDAKMSQKINKKFNALCVDMEGASIAQTAFLSGVPFLVVRAISDIPNNQNVMTYEKFLETSSKIVTKFLKKMIEKINIES